MGEGAVVWFVQSAGKVWGPYPQARLEAFVAEGRVAAETPVARTPGGPFEPARWQARLQTLFAPAAKDPPRRAPAQPADHVAASQAAAATAARPLLVWAALKSHETDGFEALLGAHGPVVRIAPGRLWLVRARVGPAALRNTLTRRIGGGDALMVVEAPIDQAAWFNLDGETDRALRQLWIEPKG